MATTSGAVALARTLERAGVRAIFNLSGNQILPVYDALLDTQIRSIDTRHEAAAVHMADAWARQTGEVGVAMVCGGPGFTNALTGLAVAQAEESPVLLLAGYPSTSLLGQGAFQENDQLAMAAPLCKWVGMPMRASDIPGCLVKALRVARSGRPGPVFVTFPTDVLAGTTEEPLPEHGDFSPWRSAADPDRIAEVIELLASAERPLVLAGPAAARVDQRAFRAFLRETELPGYVIESPRGFEDAALLGVNKQFARADVVLLLAKRQDFTIGFARPPALGSEARIIQIDPDASVIGHNRRVAPGIVADTADALRELRRVAADRRWVRTAWADELAAAGNDLLASWKHLGGDHEPRIHPLRLCRELEPLLRPDDILVFDGGEYTQWAQGHFSRWGAMIPGVLGAVGPALPFALGAKAACPDRRVITMIGDGAFGFHAMEIDTAVRHRLPIVVIVGNDAAWSVERHRQVAWYGADRVTSTELRASRYDQLAVALGGKGELVERAGELRPALERALAADAPSCVNLIIEPAPAPTTYIHHRDQRPVGH